MASGAHESWTTARRARLDELYAAHSAVGGTGPGRRTATEQLNWALALRLASEFQGYVRDLHDEATDVLVARAHALTPSFESVLRNLLTLNRQLETRNATSSTLQQDFARFGFKILDDVRSRYIRGESWLRHLEQINLARNGIAHSDPVKIATAAGKSALRLTHVKRWDSAVRALADALDRIAASRLAELTGGGSPW